MPATLKKIAYSVRFFRRLNDYTQCEMADALGVSVRNYQRFELGEVEPKLSTLYKISRLLKVSAPSLIRPTHQDILFRGLSSSKERGNFYFIEQSADEAIRFAQNLVEKDRLVQPTIQSELYAKLDGTIATFSPAMQKWTGIEKEKCDFQPYVMMGSALERWELAFRLGMKSGMIENFLMLPAGPRFVQEYHAKINPNPECPTSEVYFRDVTDRHCLQEWIQVQRRLA